MSAKTAETYVQKYEAKMEPVRQAFLGRLGPFFAEKDPRTLGLFLINFCAQGVGMTEPVPDWIRRAGEQTRKKGFEELGTALVHHAAHEEGHHEMMIADTKSLVGWWNDYQSPKMSAEIFLKQPFSPGVLKYRKLHEDCIAGEKPYCQISIEYEIEKVSVDYGPKMFGFIAQSLGMQVLECLSFVKEHAAIDIGHTQYNQRALGAFLVRAPNAIDDLIASGRAALDCYASYLEDCMSLGRKQAKQAA